MEVISVNKYRLPKELKYSLILSIVLLLVSLTQPSFYIGRSDFDAWSDALTLFFLGWMSFLGGSMLTSIIWLANPIYLWSIFLTITGSKNGKYFSYIASLLACSFYFVDEIVASESGSYSEITSLELGYYFWVSSMIIWSLGHYIYVKKNEKVI